ncbi:O-antigen ligase family protein [Sphingosinicella sp.]|uniref:O-antigen ligase family protein n=1 Tax=Sphingosinicella sp. TaxID=1917971 RepID=UPI001798EC88|nr:O-antigen ligase family protein [Sphingosinicella sp.]MBA4759679.1 O-antigen ligase family protein [Sphingosinicella sp.]
MTSNSIKYYDNNARYWSFLYLNIVGIFSIASLILNIPNFLSVNYNFPPVLFYSILSLLCFISIVIHGNKFRIVLTQPFFIWATFVIIIYYIHLLISYITYSERVSSTIAIDLMIILAALLPAAALTLMDRRVKHASLAVAALLLPALIVLDFVRPGLLYPLGTEGAVLGRGAATFINPNGAGEAALLATLLVAPILPPRWRIILLVVSGIGVLATFSRAAMLGWGLVLLILVYAGAVSKKVVGSLFIGAVSIVAFSAVIVTYVAGREDLAEGAENLVGRINFFQSGSLEDASSLERLYVLEAGIEMFAENPILGGGAGATRNWHLRASTHNQVVLLAAELGLVGLALWGSLLWILSKGEYFSNYRLQVGGALLAVYFGMFSHNLFNSTHWLLAFILISSRYGNRERA